MASRSGSSGSDPGRAGSWRLTVEACWPRMAARYHRPGVAEAFQGLRTMDDLPLYRMARALLRASKGRRGREFPVRLIEPASDVASGLEHKVPQFFLRNVGRVERAEEDILPLIVQSSPRMDLTVLRAQVRRYRPPELLRRWNLDEVLWLRALIRRVVFQEDWRRRFGRELKRHVRGPLFRYDPDASPRE